MSRPACEFEGVETRGLITSVRYRVSCQMRREAAEELYWEQERGH